MTHLQEYTLVKTFLKTSSKENYTWREIFDILNIEYSENTRKRISKWYNKDNNNVINNRIQSKILSNAQLPAFNLNSKSNKNKDNIDKENGMYLVLGCVHAPFVNNKLWSALLSLCKKNKNSIKGLIINGDYLDLNSLSSHDRGKMPLTGVNLGWEYLESNKYLDSILNELNSNIYKGYIYGNHEDRYNKYMSKPDSRKLYGAVLSPEKGLHLKERGFNVFSNWKEDEIQLGDLSIIHGEFFSTHLCKKYLDVFKKNMLFAHSHRVQIYQEGQHAAYNIGCMLDWDSPAFNYASKAMKKTWSNAFAVCTLLNNTTSVEIVNWKKNYFIYGGIKYIG